jgi:hypothetical protein
MKLSYLWRGLPGHPIYPPVTDATIREPAGRAVSPIPHAEKEQADG